MLLVAGALACSAVAFVPAAPVGASSLPTTTRLVSRSNVADPNKANGDGVMPGTGSRPAISGNGRFVAFVTGAVMTGVDTNGKKDVYVRDLWAGTTELVSRTDDEKPVLGDSEAPSISDDGRFVLFLTKAANLIPNDDTGKRDAFLRDRFENRTWRISEGLGDTLLLNDVLTATLSGDGTTTAYSTLASNVVGNDTNNQIDVFARYNFGGTAERVSVSSLESQGALGSENPSISDDGRYVAFGSNSLLAGGVAGEFNAYVRDRTAGSTELVNVKSDETVGDHGGGGAVISGTGRYVAFSSAATDLVASDTNGVRDVFLRDRTAGTTTRVSVSNTEGQLPTGAGSNEISDVGPTVLFFTNDQASSVPDAGGEFDVYARDVAAGTTRRISTGPSLADPPTLQTVGSIDDSGKLVAFEHHDRLTAENTFDQIYLSGPISLGPFASSFAIVTQQFQDFAGRAATAAETTRWATWFNAGQAQPPQLIAELATASTWAAKRAPLIRLYWAFFLRRPDPSGLTYWLNKYQGGASLTSIAQSFAKSSEFTNRYGVVTNAQYVGKVYANVFERIPDASGVAYWTNKLNSGALTRGAVIVQFSESSEGQRRLAGFTDITLISLGMYRAVPTAAQWNAVYDQIDLGEPQPAAFVAGTFLARADYAALHP